MKYLYILVLVVIFSLWYFYKIDIDKEIYDQKEEINKEILKEIEKQEELDEEINKQIDEIQKIKEEIKEKQISELIDESKEKNNDTVDNEIIEENLIQNESINSENILDLNIEKLNYSSNTNNLIKLAWVWLENIENITIWEYNFNFDYIDWYIYILVEENSNLNWEYLLIFELNDWTIINYKDRINFNYSDKSLLINDITPKSLLNDTARNIILQWKWFTKVISIQLSNNIVLTETSYNIINDNVMSIVIPKWLEKWYYSINIMGVDWIYNSESSIEIK